MIINNEEKNKDENNSNNINVNQNQNYILLKNIKNKFNKKNNSNIRNFAYVMDGSRLSSTGEEKFSINNIKNDSMILYHEKIKDVHRKNKRELSASEIITNANDNNEQYKDIVSILSNSKMKSKVHHPSRPYSSLMDSKYIKLNKIKIGKKRKAKKVTFKKNFTEVVDVESYKKYNLENNNISHTDKSNTKCTCFIF